MGLHEDRAAIASSLDGVTATTATAGVLTVSGYVKPPAALKPGDAWARLRGLERDGGQPFTVTWEAFVILPSDETAALEVFEALAPELVDALQGDDVAWVTAIATALYPVPNGPSHNAIQLTMIRE